MSERNLLAEDAQRGDLAAVTARLEAEDIGDSGDLALIWAAHNGHTEVARILLEYGADPAARDGVNTPYTYAVSRGHTETAALLAHAVKQPPKVRVPEKWVRVGEASVAFVGNYPAIDKKLTQVFNFETREHTSISESLRTKAAGVAPAASFDTLAPEALDKALDEFERLGGKPDRDHARYGAHNLGKPRRLPAGEQGCG
jgi:hypothetical protein